MTFMEAVRSGFSKYITFSGRARRSEFWFWTLFAIIISVVAMLVDGMIFPDLMTAQMTDAGASFQSQGGPISLVVSLGLLLPGLAMAVRRLHDTDRSGWWLLIGLIPLIGLIVLIVWYVTEGTKGPNRFGADPKA
jgi:uncharacterized membrane protein YhaH (DUF805 family)